MRGRETGGGTLEDPLLFLYSSFDPANPCANVVGANDDGGCGLDARIALDDLAPGAYTLVATSFDAYDGGDTPEGTYTLEFDRPAPVCAAGVEAAGAKE